MTDIRKGGVSYGEELTHQLPSVLPVSSNLSFIELEASIENMALSATLTSFCSRYDPLDDVLLGNDLGRKGGSGNEQTAEYP